MSKCASCHGSGSVACAECDGMGYTLHLPDDEKSEDLVRKMCVACHGHPLSMCHACAGTGVLDKPPAIVGADIDESTKAVARKPGHSMPDRLAGKWKGEQGTWYEFVPDGDGQAGGGQGHHYRATAGGPMGISATGTAVMIGHRVKLDATDRLVGHFELELILRGEQLDGIDRKLGFPIPVVLSRA